jgi:hypothetical protein
MVDRESYLTLLASLDRARLLYITPKEFFYFGAERGFRRLRSLSDHRGRTPRPFPTWRSQLRWIIVKSPSPFSARNSRLILQLTLPRTFYSPGGELEMRAARLAAEKRQEIEAGRGVAVQDRFSEHAAATFAHQGAAGYPIRQ